MKMLKQSLIGAVVVVVLMALVAVLFSPAALAQIAEKVKTSVVSVLVVNTASDPVPVTGTVNLESSSDNPLWVRTSAIQPVHFDSQFSVPSGKWLVAEYISAEFFSTVPCTITVELRVTPVGGGAPPVRHTYFPHFIGQDNSGSYHYGLSETIRAYIDEGEAAVLGSSSTCGNLSVSNRRVTGHLTDKQ